MCIGLIGINSCPIEWDPYSPRLWSGSQVSLLHYIYYIKYDPVCCSERGVLLMHGFALRVPLWNVSIKLALATVVTYHLVGCLPCEEYAYRGSESLPLYGSLEVIHTPPSDHNDE